MDNDLIVQQFHLDPNHHHLNHGSFGATPTPVLQTMIQTEAKMEQHPDRWFRSAGGGKKGREEARAAAADAFGGEPGHYAFVTNVTTGINAAVQSLTTALRKDPTLCLVSFAPLAYNACRAAFARVAERMGVEHVIVDVPLFDPPASAFVDGLAAVLETHRVAMVLVDHIVSTTSQTLPLQDILHGFSTLQGLQSEAPGGEGDDDGRGFLVVVDGAHAPGYLDLDVGEMGEWGADVYVGNLHKWVFCPKGTAFVYGASQRGREMLEPTVVSHLSGAHAGFPSEFDDQGTRSDATWLSLPAALGWIQDQLGGLEAMRAVQKEKRARALEILCQAWDVQPKIVSEVGAMALLPLPHLPECVREGGAWALSSYLHREHKITSFVVELESQLYIRISAQVYTSDTDFDVLAAAILSLPSSASNYPVLPPYTDW